MTDRYPIPEFLRRQPVQIVTPVERPILFSDPMVRAILAGNKTQTRRLLYVPSASKNSCFDIRYPPPVELPGFPKVWALSHWRHVKPGDQLWVREAFMHEPADYCWEASVSIPSRPAVTTYRADFEGDTRGAGWKPSIHMPRWASRILLEITAVRVERLHDISEADARAEGVEPPDTERDNHDYSICPQCGGTGLYDSFGPNYGVRPDTDCALCDSHAKRYRYLWESINGPGSWAANPWVWCLTFKRV